MLKSIANLLQIHIEFAMTYKLYQTLEFKKRLKKMQRETLKKRKKKHLAEKFSF